MVTVQLQAQSGYMVTPFSIEHTKQLVNRYSASKLLKDYFIARINHCSVARIMALTPQNSGNNEIRILDRETLRVGPIAAGEDHGLLQKTSS